MIETAWFIPAETVIKNACKTRNMYRIVVNKNEGSEDKWAYYKISIEKDLINKINRFMF